MSPVRSCLLMSCLSHQTTLAHPTDCTYIIYYFFKFQNRIHTTNFLLILMNSLNQEEFFSPNLEPQKNRHQSFPLLQVAYKHKHIFKTPLITTNAYVFLNPEKQFSHRCHKNFSVDISAWSSVPTVI